ncbi:MAG TPA: (2Fe-2S)-binding protein [Acidobacteriota bacterium]|nr:(2Fe-2S)-binding protein [Acidobacteriota bacterium]
MRLQINGKRMEYSGDPAVPLLWVLREQFKLTGTKFGCGIAQCGACTVHLNGRATRACVTPVSAAGGGRVVTIEGLSGDTAEAVQNAWRGLDVPQCGYCQSGQIMTAVALLSQKPAPEDRDIDAAMTGNVCRCCTYPAIRKAIQQAAESLEG